jgi:hypothetical protein
MYTFVPIGKTAHFGTLLFQNRVKRFQNRGAEIRKCHEANDFPFYSELKPRIRAQSFQNRVENEPRIRDLGRPVATQVSADASAPPEAARLGVPTRTAIEWAVAR